MSGDPQWPDGRRGGGPQRGPQGGMPQWPGRHEADDLENRLKEVVFLCGHLMLWCVRCTVPLTEAEAVGRNGSEAERGFQEVRDANGTPAESETKGSTRREGKAEVGARVSVW